MEKNWRWNLYSPLSILCLPGTTMCFIGYGDVVNFEGINLAEVKNIYVDSLPIEWKIFSRKIIVQNEYRRLFEKPLIRNGWTRVLSLLLKKDKKD